tara:strand:- start:333 stop:596 length:264 start_codon:yes stop_codon:yes gene_type:complete
LKTQNKRTKNVLDNKTKHVILIIPTGGKMKYNILKLEQKPKGSVHCSAIKDQDKVMTYMSRSAAYEKIDKLKAKTPAVTFIVSRYWR